MIACIETLQPNTNLLSSSSFTYHFYVPHASAALFLNWTLWYVHMQPSSDTNLSRRNFHKKCIKQSLLQYVHVYYFGLSVCQPRLTNGNQTIISFIQRKSSKCLNWSSTHWAVETTTASSDLVVRIVQLMSWWQVTTAATISYSFTTPNTPTIAGTTTCVSVYGCGYWYTRSQCLARIHTSGRCVSELVARYTILIIHEDVIEEGWWTASARWTTASRRWKCW